MSLKSMDFLLQQQSLSNIPYSTCNTRILDLTTLNIPEQASDEAYQEVYHKFIRTNSSNGQALRDAIESIKYGIAPPVAFPTETVYGLGADATNEAAVAGIFATKGRPSDNPLIVHVASLEHLERVLDGPVPEVYAPVIRKFWPGPLTILVPIPQTSPSKFAKNVYPGQRTIGFRMPSSKYARFFIVACDRPIAGPSANSSGKPSPTTAHHVYDDLNHKINFILDGGTCQVGVESTVIDGLHDPPLILRPGGISREELVACGGRWADTAIGYATTSSGSHSPISTPGSISNEPKLNGFISDINGAPRAPGMKYKHYSPTAQLILFTPQAYKNGRVEEMLKTLSAPVREEKRKIRIGFLNWTGDFLAGLPSELQNSAQFSQDEITTTVKVDPSKWASFWDKTTCISTESHTLVIVSLSKSSSNGKVPENTRDGMLTTLAKELFGLLRFFDALECNYIFAETVDRGDAEMRSDVDKRLWDAVADRIGKAAAERIES
jgi:L-threonylcarbamoyladenylate synthase